VLPPQHSAHAPYYGIVYAVYESHSPIVLLESLWHPVHWSLERPERDHRQVPGNAGRYHRQFEVVREDGLVEDVSESDPEQWTESPHDAHRYEVVEKMQKRTRRLQAPHSGQE